MSQYNIAICDDEPMALETLDKDVRSILDEAGVSFTLRTFTSGAKLIKAAKTLPNTFDLILLDVLLGDNNGIDTAASLRKNGTASAIVLITATPDFAVKGYEVGAWRYILKPWSRETLKSAILSDYEKRGGLAELVFHIGAEVRKVPVGDICYIESKGRGAAIHLKDEVFIVPRKLSDIAAALPPGPLVRCHYSYIVNLEYVSNMKRYAAQICVQNNVPISRQYYNSVKEKLLEHLSQ